MSSPEQPPYLRIIMLGDDVATQALNYRFETINRIDQPLNSPTGDVLRSIQIGTEGLATEMVIELWNRGGFDMPNILNYYCSQGEAFLVVFNLCRRKSVNAITKYTSAIEQAGRGQCPIALVGVCKPNQIAVVMEQEAMELAAQMGLPIFFVRRRSFEQVMAPFVHLSRRRLRQTI
ncbi:hypothetical protein AYL99_11701 [Fonsecaea erecta]|uniref:Uncharacterized protein n=1 Tax=Fonsecaea erecta TaxID=1367422 RepID=A0A178Z3V6_9EURO|nr:hypothetical protein AYL99_11701 [Fonsecaea erecta]OAP54166.1 hypothetical protein AYL99_11701 [Fonsecaea erecta]